MPVATAITLGARFPYITPGARFPVNAPPATGRPPIRDLQFADGGYFENTGAALAVSLIDLLRERPAARFGAERAARVEVDLIRMLGPYEAASLTVSEAPRQLALPIHAIYNSRAFKRDNLGRVKESSAIQRYDLVCDYVAYNAPPSWQLSRSTRDAIWRDIDRQLDDPESDGYALAAELEAQQTTSAANGASVPAS